MPAFLEKKLKSEYGADSSIPYKIMNSMGAMRGSKETDKGREMQKKHDAMRQSMKVPAGKKMSIKNMAERMKGKQ